VSTGTLAPSGAHAAPVCPPRVADPESLTGQRLAAEQALTDLERKVRDIAQRFFAPTRPPSRTVPRRSRRSAWLPTDY
jgi:hypothetical protein